MKKLYINNGRRGLRRFLMALLLFGMLFPGVEFHNSIYGAAFYGKGAVGEHSVTSSFYGPMVMGFGYSRRLKVGGLSVDLQPELALPVTLLKNGDSGKVNLGASSLVFERGIWGLGVSADLWVATGGNSMGNLIGLGYGLGLLGGLFNERRFVALELRFADTPLTHIRHSPYQQGFFNDIPGESAPSDGWYRSENIRLFTGLTAGFHFSQRLTLVGSLGYAPVRQRQGVRMFEMVGIIPIYAPIYLVYHF